MVSLSLIPKRPCTKHQYAITAERGVEVFFTQVFRDSFFHADMHRAIFLFLARLPITLNILALIAALSAP